MTASKSTASPLVEATDLVRHFRHGNETVRAVDGVSLHINQGETLGLVGESGCGKSTLGRTLLRLYSVTAGKIHFDGRDVTSLRGRHVRALRRDMQMIFQDPLASLNPRMRVERLIAEPLREHNLVRSNAGARVRVAELLDLVALPTTVGSRYPAELSGGQRQRVAIARALAVNPRLIVADEAVAALDVSVAAQVVNLLDDLRSQMALSYLFISHDLSMVRHLSDRVAIMYLGRIVEAGPTSSTFARPLHPYTVALMSAIPKLRADHAPQRSRIILSGDPPSPVLPPPGCRFHTRCPIGPMVWPDRRICAESEPPLQRAGANGQFVACHFPGELSSTARR